MAWALQAEADTRLGFPGMTERWARTSVGDGARRARNGDRPSSVAILRSAISARLRRRASTAVLAVLAVFSSLVSGCGLSSNSSGGHFYVVGDKIVAPNGSTFFPEGANLATPDTLQASQNALGKVKAVQGWGWNTVRLVTMCTKDGADWSYGAKNGIDKRTDPKTPDLHEVLDTLIKQYTSKHIVVDVSCFDTKYGDDNFSTVMPELNSFWTYMGHTYKSNPYVWFDPLNEGFWQQPADQFVSWYSDMYKRIRATGAQNLMLVDPENTAEDAGWGNLPQIPDPSVGPKIAGGRCNVAFAMHSYGGLSDNDGNNYSDMSVYQDYFHKVQQAGLAMMIEEYGYTVQDPKPDNMAGTNAALTVAKQMGIGSLWWAGISNDGFSLKASGGTFDDGSPQQALNANLSPAGQAVWQYSHSAPDLGKFHGKLKDSHCSGA